MKPILAFDVYGTLIDVNGVEEALAKRINTNKAAAASFSRLWRAKQLEYAFRRGLMRDHDASFADCTAQALDYATAYYKVPLGEGDKKELLDAYKTLPAFPDAGITLKELQEKEYPLFAFSNGAADAVRALLEQADILPYFRKVISVEDVASFKPDPAVYRHFVAQAGGTAKNAYLISGNSFDVLGAMSFGMQGIWIQRDPETIFDNWGKAPTAVLQGLNDLPTYLTETEQAEQTK